MQVRQLNQNITGHIQFAPLVIGIHPLRALQLFRNLPLGQIRILPQFPNPSVHLPSPKILYPPPHLSIDF